MQADRKFLGALRAPARSRILAVDRIHPLAVTKEAFTVAAAFDPKRYEAEAFGVTWEKPMTVVVRFSAEQAPYVREREWHPTQRICTRRAAATYRQRARTPNGRGRPR
jgi:hypothetical protein